ncbi:MAG TPA: phage baseplate assembly protein V [Myxococcota bacterium]|jgi:hypothetical protein|nr:phage baseplate assembly protein V [Myxococcota bacterium]
MIHDEDTIAESVADLEVDRRSDYGAGRLFGVYTGIVTNNQDPDNRGRVKVRFPWLSDADESWWARVTTFYAGKGRGSYFMPEVEDEVLVVFEHGDFSFPYVVGSVWNGVDKVPGPGNADGQNNVKHVELRTGHKVIFDDTDGANKITVIDCSGKNSLVIDVAADTITMKAQTGDINIMAPAGSVNMTCVDYKVQVSNNASYSVTNHYALQCKDEKLSVGNTQKVAVNGQMEFTCPMTTVTADKLQLASAQVGATIGAAALTYATTTVEGDVAEKTVGTETATIGTYQLTGTEIGLESQGPITVNAAASYEAKSKTLSAGAQGAATLTAGMVKADGNPGTVLVKGSVVTLS